MTFTLKQNNDTRNIWFAWTDSKKIAGSVMFMVDAYYTDIWTGRDYSEPKGPYPSMDVAVDALLADYVAFVLEQA